jgi:hypothetical protein
MEAIQIFPALPHAKEESAGSSLGTFGVSLSESIKIAMTAHVQESTS